MLDFGAMGMRWEITHSASDTAGQFFEAINVLAPGFAGPPLHTHPSAEESYSVVSGTLDVCIDGAWRQLESGQSVTVPPGTPHTLRNTHPTEVTLVNVHKPALEFEPFFRKLQALVIDGRMKLPPKDFQSLILVSMLFVEHEKEIRSANPPHSVMRLVAFFGKLLGYGL
jgi:mannose-6-phosphate isomerase-like protein (cupin superfamily)